MARATRASFNLLSNPLALLQAVAGAAATVASGKNPDATNYNVPVDAGALTATALAAGTTDVAVIAATPGLRLCGFSAKESASSAAVASFNIYNGDANSDPLVATVELAADASIQHTFPEGGIDCAGGVFIDRVAGDATVVVYTRVVGQ